MFDMQGYIIYVVLYFVIWLEFISESYFYVPTINKVFNNKIIINKMTMVQEFQKKYKRKIEFENLQ